MALIRAKKLLFSVWGVQGFLHVSSKFSQNLGHFATEF
jgi:hypothetical protein